MKGQARFEGPHRVRVGDEVYEADQFFLDVGGRAVVPEAHRAGLHPLTNTSMMDVDFLPEHLIVVGGSYVGLEFAQMYRRFGSRVTIVEQGPRLIPREDEDVSAEVRRFLELEGIARPDVDHRARAPRGRAIRHAARQSETRSPGSHVLAAVGRRPNTDDLGLDRAGVRTDARGYVEVDDALRTSAPHVWALGDFNGRGAFTHTSYNDYEIVAGEPARRATRAG